MTGRLVNRVLRHLVTFGLRGEKLSTSIFVTFTSELDNEFVEKEEIYEAKGSAYCEGSTEHDWG